MIITQRSANLSYSTDAVAHSLRSTLVAGSGLRTVRSESISAGAAPLDLNRLYPNLVEKPAVRRDFVARAIRGAAFRLSVIGSAAMMLALLHR